MKDIFLTFQFYIMLTTGEVHALILNHHISVHSVQFLYESLVSLYQIYTGKTLKTSSFICSLTF